MKQFCKNIRELNRITSPTEGGNADGMDAFRLELCDYFVGCIHPSSLNSGIKTKSEALLNVETKLNDLLTLVFWYLSCVIYYTITTSARKAASASDCNAADPKTNSKYIGPRAFEDICVFDSIQVYMSCKKLHPNKITQVAYGINTGLALQIWYRVG